MSQTDFHKWVEPDENAELNPYLISGDSMVSSGAIIIVYGIA